MELPETPETTPPKKEPTKRKRYETLDAYMMRTRLALENSKHPAIAPLLAEYGFTPAAIAKGKAMHDAIEHKRNQQIKEHGEQLSATDALAKALADAKAPYLKHVELSRIAFNKQKGVLKELVAKGRRKKSQAAWLADATTFYTNLLAKPEYRETMATYGQTEANLNDAFALVQKANALLAARAKETGEAQTATQARNEALKTFEQWYEKFVTVAKLACQHTPELLEIMGIKI